MNTPRHDTPHPKAPRGYIQHGCLRRTFTGAVTTWVCESCGAPHEWIPVPDDHIGAVVGCPSGWIVAVEARPCPSTFETPCTYCGRCYECAPDCAGMAMILGGMVPGVHVAGSVPVTPGDA